MLADHLQNNPNSKYFWQHLLDRTVDAFVGIILHLILSDGKGKYNPELGPLLPLSEFHINAPKIKWEELEPKVEKPSKKTDKKK